MVINSTNINKTNNYLQPSLELNINKMTMKYDVVNTGPGLGQAQKCDSVKLVNGISNGNTNIN